MTLPKRFPGVTFSFLPADIVSQILNFGLPAPIDIQIVGRDIAANRVFAGRLLTRSWRRCRASPTCASSRCSTSRALHLDVDRTRAAQIGLTQRDVATNLLISLSRQRPDDADLLAQSRRPASATPSRRRRRSTASTSLQDLGNIPMTGAAATGRRRCRRLATVTRDVGTQVVSHYNVQPVIDIYGAVQGRDLGSVAREIEPILDARAEGAAARIADHRPRPDRDDDDVVRRLAGRARRWRSCSSIC